MEEWEIMEEWEVDFSKGGPGSGRRANPSGRKLPYRGGRRFSDAVAQFNRHNPRPGTENWTPQQHVAEAVSDVAKAQELANHGEFGRAATVLDEAAFHATAAAAKNIGIGSRHPNFQGKLSQSVHNDMELLYEAAHSGGNTGHIASKATNDVARLIRNGERTAALQQQAVALTAQGKFLQNLQTAIHVIRGMSHTNNMLATDRVGGRGTLPGTGEMIV